jgi:iron complex outermembrane receptor protein
VFRIEGVTVQAQRPVTTVGGASAVEVQVDALGLPAAAPTSDVLRKISGVHVRTNSRGQAEISVRGSESRQVAVFMDGVPLTLGYDARTDVSVLPSTALTAISFVRGMSTLLWGPNVLGGVIELDIARGGFPQRRSVEVSGSVDNVGGYSTAASGTFPFGSPGVGCGLVGGGVGFRDSPGMPLPDGVEEPVDTGDDLRLNTDYRNVDGFLAFGYRGATGAWASLSATSHKGDRGIAAELESNEPRLWRYPVVSRTIVAASAGTGERETPFGSGDLEASIGYDRGVTEIRSYTTRAYDVLNGFEDGDDRTLSLRLLGDHSLGERGDLRTAFTYAGIRHDETIDDEFREFEQKLLSVAGETVWRLVDRPGSGVSALHLSFGGAYDRATTPLTGGLESLPAIDDWGARAGLSALLNDGGTIVHASASRRGRFPALRETYSEALDRFEANPDLRPEHLVALEAGVTSRFGEGEVQVVGFHHALTDAIRRISLPNGKRQRVNSDELKSVGVELYLTQTLGRVELGGEATFQSVELTDPATSANINPENVPETSGSIFARVPLSAGLTSTLEAEYTGSQFCIDPDSGDDVELDGGSWLNAGLSKVWALAGSGGGRRIETSIAASNLGDTALYDSCGLPRAGRLFRFQVRVF